jgi:hypothetical protein
LPVKAGDAVVTLAEWKQLQARLVDGVVPRTRTENTSLLLDIALCMDCNAKLYRQRAVKRGKEYVYYRCASVTGATKTCSGKSIRADWLEQLAIETLMDEIGDVEIQTKVLVPGEDHSVELEEAKLSLEELAAMAGSARSKTAQQLYRSQMEALDARIAELETLPYRPDAWEWVGTGATYRERWGEDSDDNRRLLLDAGITLTAKEGPFEFHLFVPHDIKERIWQTV